MGKATLGKNKYLIIAGCIAIFLGTITPLYIRPLGEPLILMEDVFIAAVVYMVIAAVVFWDALRKRYGSIAVGGLISLVFTIHILYSISSYISKSDEPLLQLSQPGLGAILLVGGSLLFCVAAAIKDKEVKKEDDHGGKQTRNAD